MGQVRRLDPLARQKKAGQVRKQNLSTCTNLTPLARQPDGQTRGPICRPTRGPSKLKRKIHMQHVVQTGKNTFC